MIDLVAFDKSEEWEVTLVPGFKMFPYIKRNGLEVKVLHEVVLKAKIRAILSCLVYICF